ncbi:MAG: tRNA 2-methylthio-N6-isopentenyl adenosine(37) hydroxylase MiaE [Bacteroidetes bacterium]|jgi:tRNA-(ms[2]io[6]A)-hydroxylase|nr:tRNA 2-methylthio-N6-isopentenyl adenosine(37) hydroxylase MiaE [Bacteroidota bacterium]
MLGLKLPTDPRWANLAEKTLEDILSDHAYCEQKAATSCITLIQLFPDKELLVEKLAPIVTEEWGHFRQVLNELKKRNLSLEYQRKDEYVNSLFKFEKKGGSRENRLVEKLLICALIEARSCERFRLLSQNMQSNEMRSFYHQFMVAEAGHYRLFLDLAYHYGQESQVKRRWQEYLDYEKELIRNLSLRGDRMH